MEAGFIGLGHLGRAMAQRLADEGVELVAWNRTIGKARGLDARVAESPREVVEQVEVVFLNLTNSEAVDSVLTMEDGLLEGNCRGRVVVDTTTNHYEEVDSFYRSLKEAGGEYLEAPVIGSVVPASQGTLTVLVSGDGQAYQKAEPYLEIIGSPVFYLERQALATKMKLVNNLALGSFMATLAEAIATGEEVGVEKEKVLEILSHGAGDSLILNAKKEKLLQEDFSAHFKASLMYKDLHYLQDLAWSLGRPLFTGSMAKELYALSYLEGEEDLDFSVIYKMLKGRR